MRVLSSLFKVGFGGGALYFAIDQDLFSANQKETIAASKKIFDSMPVLKDYSDQIVIGVTKDDMVHYWNSGVKTTISALANLPTKSKDSFHRGVDYMTDEIKKQMKS